MKPNTQRAALSATATPSETQHASLRASLPMGAEGIEVDEKSGVIRSAAVMKIGPAAGHGFSLDAESLRQIESLGKANPGGFKVRIHHPSVDDNGVPADDVTSVIGFVDNLHIVGDAVRGDVHLEDYAEVVPGLGDVRTYLLRRAKSRPEDLGLSCVIGFDLEQVMDGAGTVVGQVARIVELDAIDVVGRGAATPNGLLSQKTQINVARRRPTLILFKRSK